MSEAETLILSTATPHEERIDLAADLKTLKEDGQQAEAAIARLAQEKSRAEDDLAAFRAALMAESAPGGVVRPSNASY